MPVYIRKYDSKLYWTLWDHRRGDIQECLQISEIFDVLQSRCETCRKYINVPLREVQKFQLMHAIYTYYTLKGSHIF